MRSITALVYLVLGLVGWLQAPKLKRTLGPIRASAIVLAYKVVYREYPSGNVISSLTQ